MSFMYFSVVWLTVALKFWLFPQLPVLVVITLVLTPFIIVMYNDLTEDSENSIMNTNSKKNDSSFTRDNSEMVKTGEGLLFLNYTEKDNSKVLYAASYVPFKSKRSRR